MATMSKMHTARYFDSDDDDDDESLSERQEEQALSKEHGEAEEARGEKRKSAQELQAEYGEETKKRAPRPKLTTEHLTGMNGFIRIPLDFKTLSFRGKNRKDVKAAAAYSRALMQAYANFSHQLFPGAGLQDNLLTIEKLGTKKEVKDYMQHMREGVRNRHVEALYGQEKAERMIQELQVGLRQEYDVDLPEEESPATVSPPGDKQAQQETTVPENQPPSAPRLLPTASNPYLQKKTSAPTQTQSSQKLSEKQPAEQTSQADDDAPVTDKDKSPEAPKRKFVVEDDSDQENEMDFGDELSVSKELTDNAEVEESPSADESIVEKEMESSVVETPTQQFETQVPTQIVETTEVPTQIMGTAEVPTQMAGSAEVPTQIVETAEVPTQIMAETQMEDTTTQVPTQEADDSTIPTQMASQMTNMDELTQMDTLK